MNSLIPFTRFFFAPEHGGSGVHGGGHPADSSAPASEAINDAFGAATTGHAEMAGAGDPGAPGSQSFDQDVAELAHRFWEEEGRPEGKAQDHWERAEREIRGGKLAERGEQRTPAGENL